MNWLSLGALWALVGVGMGAFGAHGLEKVAGPEEIAWWETAASYHLIHALGLIACGLAVRSGCKSARAAMVMFAGSLVFSGTLYAMALGAPRWFGAITPLGGVLMMVGWLLLALSARGANSE